MDKREFSGNGILAGEAPQDAPVTTRGWVRTRRDSKAGLSFIHLHDVHRIPLDFLVSKSAEHQPRRAATAQSCNEAASSGNRSTPAGVNCAP